MALKPPIVTGDCWAVMRYVCAYCGREAALAELEHSCPGCAAKRCGLEANKSSRWDRDAFEHQVAWCVERLWYAK